MKVIGKTPNKAENNELNIEKSKKLGKQNALLIQQVEELTAKLGWYEEQFRLNQHRRFCSSSEKVHPDQLSIFNEAEKKIHLHQ